MSKNLLVVGASGSIGRHAVAVALEEKFKVRALVRNPSQKKLFASEVDIVVGDLTQPETLSAALIDIDAIVMTHGTYGTQADAEAVDYGAVRNILINIQHTQPRIALMTTIGTTDRRGMHDWKRRGEWLVRASGLPYPFFASQKSIRSGFGANSLAQTFALLYEGAGVEGASSHSGRRSFLTNLANKGTAIHILKTLAGHRSISTTAAYLYSSPNQLKAAVELV